MSTELEPFQDNVDEDANTPLYALVSLSVAVRSDLEAPDRTLLLLLHFFCGVANEWAGAVEELATFMKWSTKQTRTALQRLEAVKAIRIDRRAGQPSRYSILNRYGYVRNVHDGRLVWNIPEKAESVTDSR